MLDKLVSSIFEATRSTIVSLLGDDVIVDCDTISGKNVTDRITLENSIDCEWDTSAVIAITGDISGYITISCCNTFSNRICRSMFPPTQQNEIKQVDVYDMTGEFLNIVVGNSKSLSDLNFKISPPIIIAGSKFQVFLSTKSKYEKYRIVFTINQSEVFYIDLMLVDN